MNGKAERLYGVEIDQQLVFGLIPVETVCRDYFSHLTVDKFVRKVSAGEIRIPLVRMEASQKAAKGVHLTDLAVYLDERRAAAVKECQQLQR